MALAAVYSAGLTVALLSPSPAFAVSGVSLVSRSLQSIGIPAVISTGGGIEFICNVLVIVPLSALGSMSWPSLNWRDWLAAGFVLSGVVETVQALILPQRSAQFADLAANTIGAATGAGLVALWRLLRRTSSAA